MVAIAVSKLRHEVKYSTDYGTAPWAVDLRNRVISQSRGFMGSEFGLQEYRCPGISGAVYVGHYFN